MLIYVCLTFWRRCSHWTLSLVCEVAGRKNSPEVEMRHGLKRGRNARMALVSQRCEEIDEKKIGGGGGASVNDQSD